jgi:hypothetical protein
LNDAVAFGIRSLSESLDLVVRYVKQELISPLRGAGRWLGFGLLASFFLVLASFLLLLGILRLLQSESLPFGGGWSWVPYLVVVISAMVLVVFSLGRISKPTLNNEGHRG